MQRAGFLGDHAATLDHSAEALRLAKTHTPDADAVLKIGHYRAHALLATGREDEALAEYIAIYNAAPETHWGMLAALFLAPLSP
jgi:hypothetical protein